MELEPTKCELNNEFEMEESSRKEFIKTKILYLGAKLFIIFGVVFVAGSLEYVFASKFDNNLENPETITPVEKQKDVKYDLENIMNKEEYKALHDLIIRASGAYAYVPETGTVLFSKNENEVHSLASVIKLLVAVQATDIIPEDEVITIKSGDLAPYGDYGFLIGEKFTFKNLRHIMLTASSNDAAWTLARVGGEKILAANPDIKGKTPQEAFLDLMNSKAKNIGLTSISTKSITGLDLNNETIASAFGSAKEVSLLVNYIIKKYPEISEDSRQSSIAIPSNLKMHEYSNTNKYLSTINDLLLSKTGYTKMTGGNLVIARKINDHASAIVVVLGSDREGRFIDTLTINSAIGRVFQ